MEVRVVRHACAGRKGGWPGPDDDRPLDTVGHVQAAALDHHLAGCRITRVLSSPARRCIDTVHALARRHGVPVEAAPQLRAGVGAADLVRFLADRSLDGAVLCTHGEAMQALLPLLQRSGCLPAGDGLDLDRLLAKGVVWTLQLDADRDLPFVALRHQLPAGMRTCSIIHAPGEHHDGEASGDGVAAG